MLQDVLFCSDSYWKAFSDTSFNVRSMALEYVPRARLGKEALARGVAARVEIPGTISSMWNFSCGGGILQSCPAISSHQVSLQSYA
jgi:hypothetical protein